MSGPRTYVLATAPVSSGGGRRRGRLPSWRMLAVVAALLTAGVFALPGASPAEGAQAVYGGGTFSRVVDAYLVWDWDVDRYTTIEAHFTITLHQNPGSPAKFAGRWECNGNAYSAVWMSWSGEATDRTVTIGPSNAPTTRLVVPAGEAICAYHVMAVTGNQGTFSILASSFVATWESGTMPGGSPAPSGFEEPSATPAPTYCFESLPPGFLGPPTTVDCGPAATPTPPPSTALCEDTSATIASWHGTPHAFGPDSFPGEELLSYALSADHVYRHRVCSSNAGFYGYYRSCNAGSCHEASGLPWSTGVHTTPPGPYAIDVILCPAFATSECAALDAAHDEPVRTFGSAFDFKQSGSFYLVTTKPGSFGPFTVTGSTLDDWGVVTGSPGPPSATPGPSATPAVTPVFPTPNAGGGGNQGGGGGPDLQAVNICPEPRPSPDIAACVRATALASWAPGGATPDPSSAAGAFGQVWDHLQSKAPFGYVAQAVEVVDDALTNAAGGEQDWCFTFTIVGDPVEFCIAVEAWAEQATVIRPLLLVALVLVVAWGALGYAMRATGGSA